MSFKFTHIKTKNRFKIITQDEGLTRNNARHDTLVEFWKKTSMFTNKYLIV
jgi:hypothetical protein